MIHQNTGNCLKYPGLLPDCNVVWSLLPLAYCGSDTSVLGDVTEQCAKVGKDVGNKSFCAASLWSFMVAETGDTGYNETPEL